MLMVGDPAPGFSALDHEGTRHTLADYAGRHLVLWFYPKASTPGWILEGRGFRSLMDQFTAKNASVLGVSFDSRESNAKFHRRFGLNFPLICDTDRTMGLAYGAAKRPGTGGAAKRIGVIINTEGRIHLYDRSAGALGFPKAALRSLWAPHWDDPRSRSSEWTGHAMRCS